MNTMVGKGNPRRGKRIVLSRQPNPGVSDRSANPKPQTPNPKTEELGHHMLEESGAQGVFIPFQGEQRITARCTVIWGLGPRL